MKFLVDVNLPKNFSFFNTDGFVHWVDINPQMSDDKIWDYALENNLIILTKDSDFYFKSVREESHVKVVYFKLVNQKLSDLYKYFSNNWKLIKDLIENNRLVLASVNEVEIIL
ncbi:MAG: DUF5615 family PIN-like protein [Ignavibacteria bacterium]|nr:DUF5615 family PIN-like protein [Ignavibacteria bacterium]